MAKACKSRDELVKMAESEGIELTVEQLDSFAGGGTWSKEMELFTIGHGRNRDGSAGCGGTFETYYTDYGYCPICGGCTIGDSGCYSKV